VTGERHFKHVHIIKGAERVIVSSRSWQNRSPGVFLREREQPQLLPRQYSPTRGSWVEFEYDNQEHSLYVRIDRKRRNSLGFDLFARAGNEVSEDILALLNRWSNLVWREQGPFWNVSPESGPQAGPRKSATRNFG